MTVALVSGCARWTANDLGTDLVVPFGEIHVISPTVPASRPEPCAHGEPQHSGGGAPSWGRVAGPRSRQRSRQGLLQAFQYPTEVPGIGSASSSEAAAERSLNGEDLERSILAAAEVRHD